MQVEGSEVSVAVEECVEETRRDVVSALALPEPEKSSRLRWTFAGILALVFSPAAFAFCLRML